MKISHIVIFVITVFATHNMNAQEITMFPGIFGTKYYQDATQISKQQVESLMLNDSEANQLWQKSKEHLTIAWIALGAEVGFLIWQLNRASNNESQIAPLIGVIGTAGVAIGFSISASNLQKKSILTYNNNADVGSLNIGPTYNGLGLVLSF